MEATDLGRDGEEEGLTDRSQALTNQIHSVSRRGQIQAFDDTPEGCEEAREQERTTQTVFLDRLQSCIHQWRTK